MDTHDRVSYSNPKLHAPCNPCILLIHHHSRSRRSVWHCDAIDTVALDRERRLVDDCLHCGEDRGVDGRFGRWAMIDEDSSRTTLEEAARRFQEEVC